MRLTFANNITIDAPTLRSGDGLIALAVCTKCGVGFGEGIVAAQHALRNTCTPESPQRGAVLFTLGEPRW